MRPSGVWTSDITDPLLTVLAAGFGLFVGMAIGVGKLDLSVYALAAPVPLALAAAVALGRSLARAVLAGMAGSCVCLCTGVPLALIREWASMF